MQTNFENMSSKTNSPYVVRLHERFRFAPECAACARNLAIARSADGDGGGGSGGAAHEDAVDHVVDDPPTCACVTLLGSGCSGTVLCARLRNVEETPVAIKVFRATPNVEKHAVRELGVLLALADRLDPKDRLLIPHIAAWFRWRPQTDADICRMTLDSVMDRKTRKPLYVPDQTYPVIVTEYLCDTVSLRQLHKRFALFSPERTNVIIRSIVGSALKAVCALHRAGVVHRDLKPDNVRVRTSTWSVVLIDFGFSALQSPSDAYYGDNCALHTLQLAGTPKYMAPELLDAMCRNEPITWDMAVAADLWSIGASLLSGLCGKHVLPPCRTLRSLYTASKQYAQPPAELYAADRDVNAVLYSLLSRDPSLRSTVRI